MTQTTSPLIDFTEGWAQLLAERVDGLAWQSDGAYPADVTGIFVLAMPQKPARLVTLAPTLLGGDATLSMSTVGLQVRCRSAGADPRDVMALDDSISTQMLGLFPVTLPNGVRVSLLTDVDGSPMGQDDNQLWHWTHNWHMSVYRPSPNRH